MFPLCLRNALSFSSVLIAIISDAYSAEVKNLAERDDVRLGDELKLYIYHKCTQTPVINKIFRAGEHGVSVISNTS